MTPLDLVLSRLEAYGRVKKQGKEYICHCPAHEDKKSSLCVTETSDGKVLIKCQAFCETENILDKLGLSYKDLFSDNGEKPIKQEIAFDYVNEEGKLIYQIVRKAGKEFPHRRPNGNGGWIWNMEDTKRLPYNLPAVIKAIKANETVYVVEGEKDADNLMSLGLTATTNSGGAGSWANELTQHFLGAKVVILPDNDQPGHKHAQNVCVKLSGVAEDVKTVNLPGLSEKEDVSDWLNAGNTKDDLIKLVKETKEWRPQEQSSVGILMSEVQPEKVDWLWPARIVLGKLNIIDGNPGEGKSTLTLDIASRVSTGKAMPNCVETREPAGVVIASAEDGLADTIKPRLLAAGADCNRILALTTIKDTETEEERPLTLPDDLGVIREAINRINAKLLVIDPLMAFLSGDVNSHRDQDIRRVLHAVANLAEDTGVAVVVIRHLNKSNTGNALYRGGGSIGIIGAARSGLLVATDPDDENRRVFASIKSNLSKPPESLAFHLEDCNSVSKVVWDGTSLHNANTLLAVSGEEKGALDEAKDVLHDILSLGPIQASEVKRQAREAGISERTLQRAKEGLGVHSQKESMSGPWLWKLPKVASANSENVGNLQEKESKDQVNDIVAPEKPSEGSQTSNNGNLGNLRGEQTKPSLEQAKQMIIQEFNATEIPEGQPF